MLRKLCTYDKSASMKNSERKNLTVSSAEEDKKKSTACEKAKTLCRWAIGSNFDEIFYTVRIVLWLVAVAICCFYMVEQMMECLEKLRDPPISTQTKIIMHETMDYPAITFCYKNADDQGYDEKMLYYFNICGYWINFASGLNQYPVWRDFPFGEINLTTVWKYSTYKFSRILSSSEETFGGKESLDDDRQDEQGPWGQSHAERTQSKIAPKICPLPDHQPATPPYDGRPPDMPGESRVHAYVTSLNGINESPRGIIEVTRYFHEHGLCNTYRPPKTADKPLPGEEHGYKFFFRYHPGETGEDERMLPGGMDIFIHDPDEWWTENPLQFYRGEHLFVHTGYEAFIKVSESSFERLDRPEERCKNNFEGEESYSECMEHCRWEFLASLPETNCTAPFMVLDEHPELSECDTFNSATELFELYKTWDFGLKTECSTKCVEPCRMHIYTATVVKLADDDDFQNSFHIYFPSAQTQELHEERAYDMTLFIADFGGSLGFLLGVSILSVLEIIEGLTYSAYRMYKRKQKEHRQETEERKKEVLEMEQHLNDIMKRRQTSVEGDSDSGVITLRRQQEQQQDEQFHCQEID